MGTYPFTINGQQYSFTMSLTSGAIDVNAAVRVQFNSDARDAICNLFGLPQSQQDQTDFSNLQNSLADAILTEAVAFGATLDPQNISNAHQWAQYVTTGQPNAGIGLFGGSAPDNVQIEQLPFFKSCFLSQNLGPNTVVKINFAGLSNNDAATFYNSAGSLFATVNFNTSQNTDVMTLADINQKIQLQESADPELTAIDAEDDANYVIADNNVNVTIDLGSGKNIVGHVGEGAIVNANGGTQDRFVMSNDELITGSTPTDQIFSAGGILLKGAVGQIGSSDPWIVGPDGTKYGFNQQGDLVIQDLLGNDTYVSGYQGGPGVDYSQQTDGIFVGLSQGQAQMLLDLERPFMSYISTIFKVGQEILYTKSGLKFFNVDPLVFDLTGNGINLTPVSTAAPMLDMQGTGFAVHLGLGRARAKACWCCSSREDGTPNLTEIVSAARAPRASPRWRNTTATATV